MLARPTAAALLILALTAGCSDAGVGSGNNDSDRQRRDVGPFDDARDDGGDSHFPDGALDLFVEDRDTAADTTTDPSDDDTRDSDADAVADSAEDVDSGIDTPDTADAPDSPSDAPDAVDGDAPTDADADTGPPTPVGRGSYQYDRPEIGLLERSVAVALHPDEPWAVVLEARDFVHWWDYEAGADERLDPTPPGEHIDWRDVTFTPDGIALLAGQQDLEEGSRGVVYTFDPAAHSGEGDPDVGLLFDAVADLPIVDSFSTIQYPPDGGLPLLMSFNEITPSSFSVTLRTLDPETGATTFLGSNNSDGPCVDAAYVETVFGRTGWLLACDQSVLYYYEEGGDSLWRTDLGGFNTGNVASVSGHPSGRYALVIGNSGRRVFRFQSETMNESEDAPHYPSRDIWGVEFQATGQRALVFGGQMTIGESNFGTVIEYRHDLYAQAELTEVSISSFGGPPYVAPDDFNFTDVAWRTDCDGGLLVGGKSNISVDIGRIITFENEAATTCW